MLSRLRPGGPPLSERGARAPPEVQSQKPPPVKTVGGTHRGRGAQGRGGPEVAGGPWTTRQIECESLTLPPGRAGQGEEEEGTQERRPRETWRRANMLRRARRGPLVIHGGRWGHGKSQGPVWTSAAAEKVEVLRMGPEGEGAAKDPLTRPFQNSHRNLLDGLAKKQLTAAWAKLEQGGVLVHDARDVSCCRQREIRR